MGNNAMGDNAMGDNAMGDNAMGDNNAMGNDAAGDEGHVADWVLKAMVAVAASDGHIDTREVGLIQQIYEDRSGHKLTADAIARAAQENAKGDFLAEFAAASSVLDQNAKEEIIRAAYLVLLADNRISGEERKKLKDIAMVLKIREIHFGTILEDLAVSMQGKG